MSDVIGGFLIGSSDPIDFRYVVGEDRYYKNKEEIPKSLFYPTLKTWDEDQNMGFVIKSVNGELKWQSGESEAYGYVEIGTKGHFPVYIGDNKIDKSDILYLEGEENSEDIVTSSKKIKAIGGFIGDGSNITNINASELKNGSIPIGRLQGRENHVIVGGGSGTSSNWTKLDNLSVGNSNKVLVESIGSDDSTVSIAVVNGEGYKKINTIPELKYNTEYNRFSIGSRNMKNTLNVGGSIGIGTRNSANNARGLVVNGDVLLETLKNTSDDITYSNVAVDSDGVLKKQNGISIIPGGIIMWPEDEIPSGFAECDGCTYDTPLGTFKTPPISGSIPVGSTDEVDNSKLTNIPNGDSKFIRVSSSSIGITRSGIEIHGIKYIMYVGSPINDRTCPTNINTSRGSGGFGATTGGLGSSKNI